MTHAQEQAVRRLAASFKEPIHRLFFMEDIPQKKLRNAIKSYAQDFEMGEVPILLYDNTVLGSSKVGFLLSDRRLYQMNETESPSSGDINLITDFDITPYKVFEVFEEAIGFYLTPVGDSRLSLGKILIVVSRKNHEEITARLLQLIYALTGRTYIPRQNTADSGAATNHATPLECSGCGAAVQLNAIFCDYCGRRLR